MARSHWWRQQWWPIVEPAPQAARLPRGGLGRSLLARLMGIGVEEASFARRGFHPGAPTVQARLETIGRTFVGGYNVALLSRDADELATRLRVVDPELRGFAYEGAAMAATLLDRLTGRSPRRWRRLLEGPGEPYFYLLFVGAGWAWARLPRRPGKDRRRLDPLFGWLGIDGLGFHQGYFGARQSLALPAAPRHLGGYESRVFDMGVGRSLWFVHCADIGRIARAVESAAPTRRADLWSGLGLAATYAGPVTHEKLLELREVADAYRPALCQGSVFGAAARARSANITTQTDLAVGALCDLDAWQAHQLSEDTLPRGADAESDDAYETWRLRIQSRFEPRFSIPASPPPALAGFAQLGRS